MNTGFINILNALMVIFIRLINKINKARLECVRSPDMHSLILMGDFNLAPEGIYQDLPAWCHLIEQHSILHLPSSLHESMEQIVWGIDWDGHANDIPCLLRFPLPVKNWPCVFVFSQILGQSIEYQSRYC